MIFKYYEWIERKKPHWIAISNSVSEIMCKLLAIRIIAGDCLHYFVKHFLLLALFWVCVFFTCIILCVCSFVYKILVWLSSYQYFTYKKWTHIILSCKHTIIYKLKHIATKLHIVNIQNSSLPFTSKIHFIKSRNIENIFSTIFTTQNNKK